MISNPQPTDAMRTDLAPALQALRPSAATIMAIALHDVAVTSDSLEARWYGAHVDQYIDPIIDRIAPHLDRLHEGIVNSANTKDRSPPQPFRYIEHAAANVIVALLEDAATTMAPAPGHPSTERASSTPDDTTTVTQYWIDQRSQMIPDEDTPWHTIPTGARLIDSGTIIDPPTMAQAARTVADALRP